MHYYKRLLLFCTTTLLSAQIATAQPAAKKQTYIPTGNVLSVATSQCSNIDSNAYRYFLALAHPVQKKVPLAGEREYFGTMTDYVNTFVRQYLGVHCRTLCVVDTRSKSHFSLIDNILTRHNIPKELKYLAVIESALDNNAVSPVGAVGPWQFMEGTARNMGLRVDGKRDERTDWFKSTDAAAKYLSLLYSQLDDWLLVVAAYNSGPVPVQAAIQRTGSHNFWDIKKYLPRETQGHVLAFVATASIFEHLHQFIASGHLPDDFLFGKAAAGAAGLATIVAPPKPQFTQEELKSMAIVLINDPVSLDLMAQDLHISKAQLLKWNPDYDLFIYKEYDGDTYGLRIPKDKLEEFAAQKESLTKASKRIFEEENI